MNGEQLTTIAVMVFEFVKSNWGHERIFPKWGGRPIRAKTYVSVLHAILWVGLAAVRGLLTEEVSEAEFDVAHPEYTLDGAVAQFAGQGQDIRIQR